MIGAKANLKSSEGVFEKKSYPYCKECGSDEIILLSTNMLNNIEKTILIEKVTINYEDIY